MKKDEYDEKMLSAQNFYAIPVYLFDFTSIFVHKMSHNE